MKHQVFLSAALGGVAPSLLKIALCLNGGSRPDPPLTPGYVVGLLLFAALGGTVALVWGERNLRKAFYLGVGLPSLVVALDFHLPPAPRDDKTAAGTKVGALYLFSPPAYADTLPASAAPVDADQTKQPSQRVTFEAASSTGAQLDLSYRGNRRLTLELHDVPKETEVVLRSADGKITSTLLLARNGGKGRVSLKLPDFASKISLRAGDVESDDFELNQKPGSSTVYKVERDSSFWGGFLQAMGVKNAASYQFEVKAKSRLDG